MLMGMVLNHSLDGEFWEQLGPNVEAVKAPTVGAAMRRWCLLGHQQHAGQVWSATAPVSTAG